MINPVDHAKLRALAQAATPGPWEAENTVACRLSWCDGQQRRVRAGWQDDMGNTPEICDLSKQHKRTVERANANAEFIASANPEVVLALLDELAELRRLDCE